VKLEERRQRYDGLRVRSPRGERPSVRKRDADHARPGVVVLVSVLHGWAAVTLCHHTSSHRFGLHEECQSMTPLSTCTLSVTPEYVMSWRRSSM
jgi:hypothetical protein